MVHDGATAAGPGAGVAPRWAKYLAPVFPLIVVVGYVINSVVAVAGDSGSSADQMLLEVGMSWLIGAFMIGAAIPHIIWPTATARTIGWSTSPFQ